MHVDLEFVLHLLGLAGALLPELTSEEVLAKMCRNKARIAVRHTVRSSVLQGLIGWLVVPSLARFLHMWRVELYQYEHVLFLVWLQPRIALLP